MCCEWLDRHQQSVKRRALQTSPQMPSVNMLPDLQAFLQQGNKLISCSKDSHVRLWSLDSQHCSQTLAGSGNEVWALALDPSQRRLITGSADANLQVYQIVEQEPADNGAAILHDTLKLLGTPHVSLQCH